MRIAVLGLGFMGSTHLKALASVPDAQLAAIYSSDETKLAGDLSAIQGNLGGPGEKMDFSGVRTYRDIEKLLADPGVDAVDICLPTHLHESVALQALRAGKHVLVEKPIALSGEAGDELLAEARRQGRILMAAQVLRFIPEYQALRAAVTGGELGPVRSLTLRRRCAAPGWSKWLSDPEKSGGGVFDLLIHDVDFCVHLFGAPRSVTATGHEDLAKGIDTIVATFAYDNAAPVVISGGWHHPKAFPFSMDYTAVLEGGTLEFSSAGVKPTLYGADGTSSAVPLATHDGWVEEIRYFTGCCREQRQPEFCPPEESVAAVRLTHAMREARQRQGETIECKA